MPAAPSRPHPEARSGPEVVTPTLSWYRLGPDAALDELGSSAEGLSDAEADARLGRFGRNELEDKGAKKPVRILWEQLTAIMVLILLAAAALSLALGKLLEAGAIFAIVVLFTLLGFVQEYRAERAIAALRRMAVPTVRVRRDGRQVEVPALDLVPGDIVSLEAGNVVPADLRIIEAANLRVQEAALTGESEPVEKATAAIDLDDVSLGDRLNLAFSGTQVTYGRGLGVVTATGMGTELGRIATLLQDVSSSPTPLQARLDRVGKQLALLGVGVAVVVVAMGAASGEDPSDLVLTAISVAVAVIPEGLPAVVTFTLAIGAQRMLRRNALIRKLPAVETLGSVTVICSDKTGTLTQNRMTVTVVDVAGARVPLGGAETGGPGSSGGAAGSGGADSGSQRPDAFRLTLAAAVLCNDSDAQFDEDGSLQTLGDPTETALLVAAHDVGIDVAALQSAAPRVDEVPFDSERKRMATVHTLRGAAPPVLAGLPAEGRIAFVKGAVDGLLPLATRVWGDDGPEPLDDAWRARVDRSNAEMASQGARVLGVAWRSLPEGASPEEAETDLTLLGLVGIVDPPRPEVRDAVARCTTAGIRTVMITGDHPLTAGSIARQLGIGGDGKALTGAELERLDETGLRAAVKEVSVFARVSPEHKLRIVQALRDEGQVVAMTGDGVNDAPALKKSDIGVAMGITGTDVSKEASDVVLRDDNFTTIVAAVEEGRVIYDNLRRFVRFAVAGNVGKILVMVLWPLPFLFTGDADAPAIALLPLQLLWLNLMTDGLLGLSMGVEPAEPGVMSRSPHAPGDSIWAGGLGWQATWVGILIGAAALGVGYAYYEAGQAQWQTMIFASLAFLQVFQALGSRSVTDSLRTIGLRSNPVMLATIAVVVGLQLLATYTPLRDLLDIEPLGALDLALCVALGAGLLVVLETEKAWRRRRRGPAPAVAADAVELPSPPMSHERAGTGVGTGAR